MHPKECRRPKVNNLRHFLNIAAIGSSCISLLLYKLAYVYMGCPNFISAGHLSGRGADIRKMGDM
jgi:hypothetical protein